MPFIYWLIDKQCLQKFKITVVQGLLLFNALLIVVFNKKFFFLLNIGYGIGFDVIICKFIIICCSFFFNRYLILVVISLLGEGMIQSTCTAAILTLLHPRTS